MFFFLYGNHLFFLTLTCVNELEKWLQLLFIRWYRSPRNWLPISSIIRRTSSSLKSVQPIWILCLYFCDKKKLNYLYNNWVVILNYTNDRIDINDIKIYLKRNCSPSSSWSRGVISNTPVNEKGWPPGRFFFFQFVDFIHILINSFPKMLKSMLFNFNQMHTICKFTAINFYTWMIYADAQIGCVVIYPILKRK